VWAAGRRGPTSLRFTSLPPSLPLEQTPKFFDFVVYGSGLNLLVEIKGRPVPAGRGGAGTRRLESWVAADDVSSMLAWQGLFGPEFRAVFAFMDWHDALPADGVFEEALERRGRWYAPRAVGVHGYGAPRVRSPRWGPVDLGARASDGTGGGRCTDAPGREALATLPALPPAPHPVASPTMNHPAPRRLLVPLVLALASLAAFPGVGAAQEERPKAPAPTKTGAAPTVRNMLLLVVLAGIGIGVNAIPSKRGHQD